MHSQKKDSVLVLPHQKHPTRTKNHIFKNLIKCLRIISKSTYGMEMQEKIVLQLTVRCQGFY